MILLISAGHKCDTLVYAKHITLGQYSRIPILIREVAYKYPGVNLNVGLFKIPSQNFSDDELKYMKTMNSSVLDLTYPQIDVVWHEKNYLVDSRLEEYSGNVRIVTVSYKDISIDLDARHVKTDNMGNIHIEEQYYDVNVGNPGDFRSAGVIPDCQKAKHLFKEILRRLMEENNSSFKLDYYIKGAKHSYQDVSDVEQLYKLCYTYANTYQAHENMFAIPKLKNPLQLYMDFLSQSNTTSALIPPCMGEIELAEAFDLKLGIYSVDSNTTSVINLIEPECYKTIKHHIAEMHLYYPFSNFATLMRLEIGDNKKNFIKYVRNLLRLEFDMCNTLQYISQAIVDSNKVFDKLLEGFPSIRKTKEFQDLQKYLNHIQVSYDVGTIELNSINMSAIIDEISQVKLAFLKKEMSNEFSLIFTDKYQLRNTDIQPVPDHFYNNLGGYGMLNDLSGKVDLEFIDSLSDLERLRTEKMNSAEFIEKFNNYCQLITAINRSINSDEVSYQWILQNNGVSIANIIKGKVLIILDYINKLLSKYLIT